MPCEDDVAHPRPYLGLGVRVAYARHERTARREVHRRCLVGFRGERFAANPADVNLDLRGHPRNSPEAFPLRAARGGDAAAGWTARPLRDDASSARFR